MNNQSDALARLAALADLQAKAETEVAVAEADLETAKHLVRELSETQIPELMDDLGLTEFKTKAGVRIKVLDKVRCGDLKRAEGLDWLRENGNGGLIKSEVVVPFAKGDDNEAQSLVTDLKARHLACKLTQRVAWNSLASTVKSLLEEGVDVPLEKLGVYLQRVTKLDG